jgi:polyhydroxyalkanoate synthesis regulator phasin
MKSEKKQIEAITKKMQDSESSEMKRSKEELKNITSKVEELEKEVQKLKH